MIDASLEVLRAELEDLRSSGRVEQALALAAESWRRWLAEGDIEGGHAVLEPLVAAGGPDSRERALVLYGDGLFLFRLDDLAASQARNEEALAVARRADDVETAGLALVGLSRVAFRARRYDDVVRLAEEARARVPASAQVASLAALHMHAAGTRLLGDYDRAAELYEESMDAARALGNDRMVAMEQHNLGHVELQRGNVEAAEELFAARLAYAESSRDPYEHAMTAMNDASLAAVRREDETARERLAACKRLLAENAIVLDPDDQFELDALEVLLS
jgi:tetratricopeptide (TPR) repeat protein